LVVWFDEICTKRSMCFKALTQWILVSLRCLRMLRRRWMSRWMGQ
jgi:hypothetical protein